jgi:hypothetical protein
LTPKGAPMDKLDFLLAVGPVVEQAHTRSLEEAAYAQVDSQLTIPREAICLSEIAS